MVHSLNVMPDYCAHWSVRSAVREVVQNARDVAARGGSASYEHDGTQLVVASSGGGTFDTRALIFGYSDKRDDERCAGMFGDGLKVALAVFARENVPVKIDTGVQFWTLASTPEGAVGVAVRNKTAANHRDRVVVTVGVTAREWEEWREDYLFLEPDESVRAWETPGGRVLTSPSHKGRIYVSGILVERRPVLSYGYDFPRTTVRLGRDREVANNWSLDRAIRAALGYASRANPEAMKAVLSMLVSGAADLRDVSDGTVLGRPVLDNAAALFRAAHGEDAVPVDDAAEARDVAQHGLRPAIVPRALLVVLEAAGVEGAEARIAKRSREVERVVPPAELSPDEELRLTSCVSWLAHALRSAGEDDIVVEVVDFANPKLEGTYGADGVVRLARRVLGSTRSTMATLVHEVAHRAPHADDGSAEHREEIERLVGLLAEARFGL